MGHSKVKFDCCCEFSAEQDGDQLRIQFDPDIEKIPLDCQATWDLISSGNTVGVFQVESQLGQSLCKKVQPNSINELADIVALMRPGCLESILEKTGKTITQSYIDRKHGLEEIDCYHPLLEDILKPNKGLMIYQEDCIKIVQKIARFNLQEADTLRKGIGQKDTKIIAECEKLFLDKAKEANLVTELEAKEIFSWIKKGQRYLFNSSHSYSYALIGYLTAYCKAHFPKQFFTSYLHFTDNKQNAQYEINRLVNNAKTLDIYIKNPSLLECNKHFRLMKNGDILFGLYDVKGIGGAAFEKIKKFVTEISREGIQSMCWGELLLKLDKNLPSTSVLALINSGALDFTGIARTKMAYEYKALEKLTAKEKEKLLAESPKDILSLLIHLNQTKPGRQGFASNKNRKEIIDGLIKTLQDPPYALVDSPEWLVSTEKSLLGTCLTLSNLDTCDTSSANCNCLDLAEDRMPESPIIAAQIENVKEVEIKNGKNRGDKMAFLKISDQYCEAEDIVIFADAWREARNIVTEGNTVLLLGKKDKKKGSLIVNKVYQL